MDNHQYEALRRMFYASRLQPNIEEHDLFIRGELAMLEVTDKGNYENFKGIYDEKKKSSEPIKEVAAPEVAPIEPTSEKLTEEEFRALTPAKQKELVADKVTKPKQDSTIAKRVALYFS